MTTTRDQEEQDLRIELMSTQLEHIRATVDRMERADRDARKNEKRERIRTIVGVVAAMGTAFAGGAATITLVMHAMGKL